MARTLGLILMVAMSATWSTSCTTASYCSPLASFTRTRRRLATTCALVTMSPSGDTRNPEPFEMGTSRPENGCLQGGQRSREGVGTWRGPVGMWEAGAAGSCMAQPPGPGSSGGLRGDVQTAGRGSSSTAP